MQPMEASTTRWCNSSTFIQPKVLGNTLRKPVSNWFLLRRMIRLIRFWMRFQTWAVDRSASIAGALFCQTVWEPLNHCPDQIRLLVKWAGVSRLKRFDLKSLYRNKNAVRRNSRCVKRILMMNPRSIFIRFRFNQQKSAEQETCPNG